MESETKLSVSYSTPRRKINFDPMKGGRIHQTILHSKQLGMERPLLLDIDEELVSPEDLELELSSSAFCALFDVMCSREAWWLLARLTFGRGAAWHFTYTELVHVVVATYVGWVGSGLMVGSWCNCFRASPGIGKSAKKTAWAPARSKSRGHRLWMWVSLGCHRMSLYWR